MPHSPRHGSGYWYSDGFAAPPSQFDRYHSAEPNIDPFDDGDDAADADDADDADNADNADEADDVDALDDEQLEGPRIAVPLRAVAGVRAHDPSQDLDYIPTPLSKPMGKLKTNRLCDRWQSRRTFLHPEDVTAQDLEGITAAMVRTRRPEPDLPTDHRVWVTDNHVTGTELSLRLALYLLDQNLVTADIQVALTGYELTRRSAPRFPVAPFLLERGYAVSLALHAHLQLLAGSARKVVLPADAALTTARRASQRG